ncbi:MAG: CRISPR system precrRNA processing endoribonuclease RAMP protein Cas6 [Caldilineaceae bacterium]
MPISLLLSLTSPTDATIPHQPPLGRANYAAVLARVGQVDAGLAQQIHDCDGPKPLTCSELLGGRRSRDGIHLQANGRYLVRVTGLTDAVQAGLEQAFLLAPPSAWTIGGHTFAVQETICDPAVDPWSGRTTYEALAANQLLQSGRPLRRVTLTFASPTSFKSNNMQMAVPLPNLVFGSLVERWNAFSPVTLSPEVRRFGEEMVALSNYQLQSQPMLQKNGTPLIGGVGRATYTALGGDRYWLSVMQMLGDFALFSGVGVKTTTGMGQVRRVGGE